ncbi:MAG: sigma-70 family RNA polymerase sigma factor [Verrucomicrobiae bacterium]|nr:sigma-70 family RNA polymerase sigma factor [Verrucomicrobiae bacterium]
MSATPDSFHPTRWTRVLAARGDSPGAREALGELCAAYYEPVVAFLRREGRDEDAARDLAHAFFERVLEGAAFDGADPRRGRFRSYLLGALKHFLANQRVHELRSKRGSGTAPESLDECSDGASGNAGFLADPSSATHETLFDREWALRLLDRAFDTLLRESPDPEARKEFETLKPWLTGAPADGSQADAARVLGLNDGAVRVRIHRLRRRFRTLVKAEIAQTVANPADAADELHHLIAVLS